MKTQIIIAGYGFVGKAVGNALQDKNNICIVDPKYTTSKIDHFPSAEGIIICVGTPANVLGDCDTSQIYEVMSQVPETMPVLIKCTARPDYLEKLLKDFPNHKIVYSPEFLRAKTANEDFLNQTYMVMGGNDEDGFWQTLFQESLPKCKLFFQVSIIEAAMIKYTTNAFLSLKVTFFNQIYDMCKINGADYDAVRQVLTHDSRIGSSHTLVPGFDGERGFGGACFPKDTEAFIHYADALQVSHTLVESAVKYNKKVRKKP
jgi:UDPglucose 6-dehydrogenase